MPTRRNPNGDIAADASPGGDVDGGRGGDAAATRNGDADRAAAATRVVVSYPSDLSEWGRFQVEKRSFRSYLRKTLGTVAAGERRAEFVGVGCCGDTLDVPLRIERVDGGRHVTEDTGVEFAVREACGLAGGWRVQSADGPTE